MVWIVLGVIWCAFVAIQECQFFKELEGRKKAGESIRLEPYWD